MSRKPRLLLYAPHFAEYSTRLAQSLAEHADVLLILNSDDRRRQCEPDWFRAATANLQTFEFSVHRRFRRIIWTPMVVLRMLAFRADVIHIQEQADRTSATVAEWAALRATVVETIHDPNPHSGSDSDFLARGAQRYRDRIRATASLFHAHGERCRQAVLAIESSRPVIQTHHGVIHVPEPSQIRDPEPGRILFFGRMEAYKGLEVLLEAMEMLNASGRNYSLVLAGRGPELDRLRRRAAGMSGVVICDSFLSPAEVVEEFQAAAVVVLPYLDATQSGVGAGAIGNGRPMVASDIGGLPDIVVDGNNGLLAPPGDAKALAAALDRILGDEELRIRLTAGARTAQANLSWAKIAQTIVDGYKSLPGIKGFGAIRG